MLAGPDGVWWRRQIGGCCLTIIEEITWVEVLRGSSRARWYPKWS